MSSVNRLTEWVMSPAMDRITLGRRIREAWRASGLRQKEIVAELGVKRATFDAWMVGRNPVSLDKLEQFATIIGGRLIVEIDSKESPRELIATSPEGAIAARTLDALADPEARVLLLRLLQLSADVDEVSWSTISGMLDGIEARRRNKAKKEAQ